MTDSPPVDSSGPPPRNGGPAFAHASEAELARILDFYAVRWEYEPHTFPILWNLDGDVVESFAPDFWLPDVGLYVELTTLKQRLVRKKNRKLRRLRELYPDVRVKLFYARDFRALMLKYGKLALHEALSGTLGQVPSHRLAVDPLEPAALSAAKAVRNAAAATAKKIPPDPTATEPAVATTPSAATPSAPAARRSTATRRSRRRGTSAAERRDGGR